MEWSSPLPAIRSSQLSSAEYRPTVCRMKTFKVLTSGKQKATRRIAEALQGRSGVCQNKMVALQYLPSKEGRKKVFVGGANHIAQLALCLRQVGESAIESSELRIDIFMC